MLAVGMLLAWGGYSVGLWGWCLLRGYNVTAGQLMSPLHPYGTGKNQGWPPPLMSANVIFPGAHNTGASAPPSSSSSAPSSSSSAQAPAPGTANQNSPTGL
jgi:hypothetical protein